MSQEGFFSRLAYFPLAWKVFLFFFLFFIRNILPWVDPLALRHDMQTFFEAVKVTFTLSQNSAMPC